MKVLAYFEKILSPFALIALNLVLVLSAELIGGGMFFHETGLIHAVAFIFVGIILVRVFSDYAFSDYILKGFLKIQFGFFLLIGILHVYEYFGLHVWMLNDEAVELSATMTYLVWILGLLLALQFVFRIYYKKKQPRTCGF